MVTTAFWIQDMILRVRVVCVCVCADQNKVPTSQHDGWALDAILE